MKGKGLLIAIGGPKPSEGEEEATESDGPVGDEALALAYDALKAGKSKAFVKAMKSAIKACTNSYEDEE